MTPREQRLADALKRILSHATGCSSGTAMVAMGRIVAEINLALTELPDERLDLLTDRQRDVYEFIRSEILDKHCPPTVREIGQQFGIRNPNGVLCHLEALQKRGLIKQRDRGSRNLELVEAS